MISLTKQEARCIIIHAAGLAHPATYGEGIEAVYRFIDQVGYVQIDTNCVVERAHHHAIFSRVPDYRIEWLRELVEDSRIFEYLMADSGYIPMHDYRFSLPVKESFSLDRKPRTGAELQLMQQVMNRIEREGPLTVAHFDNDRLEPSSGWWDWRPAKVALEHLYQEGKLMVTRSADFKKQYDLPFNLLPADVSQTMPFPEEYARYVIRSTLKGLGIASPKEIAWRARSDKNNLVKQELKAMADEGEVCTVQVEGLGKAALYMLPDSEHNSPILSGDAYILSPFDTLNVFRHRLRDFFGFDYQIECFVPAAKRKYGYFSLPVLIGDRFVARMDCKADRKNKLLQVHNLHFEAVEIPAEELNSFAGAIDQFARFNACRTVSVDQCNNKPYLSRILKRLAQWQRV